MAWAPPREGISEVANASERCTGQRVERHGPGLCVAEWWWPDLGRRRVPHVLEQGVPTNGDAVGGVASEIAKRPASSEPDDEEQSAGADERGEPVERGALIEMMEHRYRGDDVEGCHRKICGLEIGDDVLDVVAVRSGEIDARAVGVDADDGRDHRSEASRGFAFAAADIEAGL